MSKATMFLSQLTCIDHALINESGLLIGGSFLPSFLIHGEIDECEKVVVDFSTIKKDVKAAIDSAQDGFDHKLWLIGGFSQIDQVPDFLKNRITLKSEAVELDVPLDAIKLVTASGYGVAAIGKALENYLTAQLNKKYPGIEVVCTNSTFAQTVSGEKPTTGFFRYVHGLKDSTSWGCQNIAHGHLSFLQLHKPKISTADELSLMSNIAEELDNTIFIRRDNVVQDGKDWVSIAYDCQRGHFEAKFNKHLHKTEIIETETTVEFLAEYVKENWFESLEGTAEGLFVSEGLTKGAFVDL